MHYNQHVDRICRLIIICLMTITGCAGVKEKIEFKDTIKHKDRYQIKPFHPQPLAVEGSLWTDTGNMFFLDNRARRVGDTLTVDIIENTSSSIDANTKLSKSSSLNLGISNMLGYIRALEGKNENLNRDQAAKLAEQMIKADFENKFDGKGKSDRSGQITASIGARVREVFPNGNIVITGKREMKVNNEVQTITVYGIARPEDISESNRIKSTYLADARIEYYGKGVIADKQKPGWMTRIIDNVWPF